MRYNLRIDNEVDLIEEFYLEMKKNQALEYDFHEQNSDNDQEYAQDYEENKVIDINSDNDEYLDDYEEAEGEDDDEHQPEVSAKDVRYSILNL